MTRFYSLIFCILALACISCSDGSNNEPQLPPEEPEKPVNPGGEEIDFSKVGIEYDDGTNIIFHVKLAIDKEGYEMRDAAYFKTHLKTQWEKINERFNGLDKKKALKRNYIFVPDLENIILYSRNDNKDKPYDVHWEVPKHHNAEIDRKKFQCLVVYDFAIQEDEVGKGGGFGDDDGLANILVINPGESNVGKFYDHFSESANTAAAITHEMGHFRGITDTYLCNISANNNPVSGEGFKAETGNMNNPYPSLENCAWSDYEIRVINLNGAKKEFRLSWNCMQAYFPENIELTITENGTNIEDCTLNIYKIEDYKVNPTIIKTFSIEGNTVRKNATELFWYGSAAWSFYHLILVEVINNKTKNKGYSFIPAYEVHNQGVIDKYENKISGKSTFKRTIEIKKN